MKEKYTIVARCLRFDTWELQSPRKTEEGFLRVDAYLTRPGVFSYPSQSELRPKEEVLKQDSLSTLNLLPLTLKHPPGLVTPATAKEYTVGSVGEPRVVNDRIAASLLITHQDAIDAVERGDFTKISCGYKCDLKKEDGEYEGERYDYIQSNIRYNHVAIVYAGRAGSDIRIRMDESEEWRIDGLEGQYRTRAEAERRLAEIEQATDTNKESKKMIRIDGIEFDVGSGPAEQAVTKALERRDSDVAKLTDENKNLTAKIDELTAKIDAEKERADGLEEKVKTVSDQSVVQGLVKARLTLERQATEIIKDVKLDEMPDKDIKLAVIKEVSPNANLTGKSDEYINARFDAAIETGVERSDLDESLKTVTKAEKNDGVGLAEKARLAMIKRHQSAWKGGQE